MEQKHRRSVSYACDRAEKTCRPGRVAEATKETAEARAKMDRYIARAGAWLVERATKRLKCEYDGNSRGGQAVFGYPAHERSRLAPKICSIMLMLFMESASPGIRGPVWISHRQARDVDAILVPDLVNKPPAPLGERSRRHRRSVLVTVRRVRVKMP